ncbi:MAG: hypothetical protein DMH00_01365 [Acidobacteria bacterium]|nr:MAG: hypothetical protein DMH00_01365 [Acidobacteriota bacterium]
MSHPSRRRQRLLLWLPILLALPLIIFFLLPVDRIVATGMVEDDAFYYLKVASHVAAGHGSTFDGIDRTNGYHPLWLTLLVPIYFLLGARLDLAFRIACLLGVTLFLAADWVALGLLRRIFHELAPTALGVVFFAFLTFFSSSQAMETAPVLFLTNLILLMLASRDSLGIDADARSEWGLGALLSLVFLARLDMVFLGVAVGIALVARWLRERWSVKRFFTKTTRLFLPCLLLPAPYLAWNWMCFGHLVPISGTLKSSFPQVGPHLYVLKSIGPHVIFSLGVGAVVLIAQGCRAVGVGNAHSGSTRERAFSALAILALSVFLQLTYAVLFEKWGFAHWQVAPSFILGAVGVGWIQERFAWTFLPRISAERLRSFSGLFIVLATAVALGWGSWKRLGAYDPNSFYLGEWRAARWAKERLPNDAVLAAKSDAGLFSYFSGLKVLNINDGLVNDFDYQAAVSRKLLGRHLISKGVRWILLSVDPDNVYQGKLRFRARAYLYDSESEDVEVNLQEAIYRSDSFSVGWGSGRMFLAIVPFVSRGGPDTAESGLPLKN